MTNYHFFELDNGLKVYVHEDHSTPMVAFNICYNVGSRDENEEKTGFAHLFEHLMFGGSVNIPSYDEPLQKVGAENNAFTSPDITNYYITLPAKNIETAFWLESDRMLSLSFDTKVLEVQRKVVIEEFKQRYLNQPYGDVWLKLRPLAYQVHPYRWATIGKDIAHIENATMNDVKDFFYKHYLPNNAVLVVGGNITLEEVKKLSKKWFESIPSGTLKVRNLPQEPIQDIPRILETSAKVPLNAIYKTFPMPGRYQDNYFATDLLGDILGRSKSSRLHQKLVKERKLFNTISAYSSGSLDPGLLVISGNLNKEVSCTDGENAINEVIQELKSEPLTLEELNKVKNQGISTVAFGEVELLGRVMNLAFAANAGNADWCNDDLVKIDEVTLEKTQEVMQNVLDPNKSSTMFYFAE